MWISPQKAAKILIVHPETLRRMVRDGRLANVRTTKTPGGHSRYNEKDIRKLAISLREQENAELKITLEGKRQVFTIHRLIALTILITWLFGSWAYTAYTWRDAKTNEAIDTRQAADMQYLMALSKEIPSIPKDVDCARYLMTVEGMQSLIAGTTIHGQTIKATHGSHLSKLLKTYNLALIRTSPDFPQAAGGVWQTFLTTPLGYLAPLARNYHRQRSTELLFAMNESVTKWETESNWASTHANACIG